MLKFDMQIRDADSHGIRSRVSLCSCMAAVPLHFVCQAILHLAIRIKQTWVARETKKPVEGTDGNEPMSEKQWRDMPKGSRPKTKPSEQHEEPEKETQKATGDC